METGRQDLSLDQDFGRDARLVPRLYMGMTGMQVLSLDYIWD